MYFASDCPASSFSSLEPVLVLDALDAVGVHGDGRLLALGSYENRVYRVHLDEPVQGHEAVVVKFYRPHRWSAAQIQEEHDFAWDLQAQEVPVVAPLKLHEQTLHEAGGFFFSVSPVRGGRTPELDDLDVLTWIGRYLARLHDVGATRTFAHRPALTPQAFGAQSAQTLLELDAIAPEVRREWLQMHEQAMALVQTHWQACLAVQLRLHGDCHPGNILWTPEGMAGEGPHFVDLDDARTGPAVQDLWMLLGGDRAQQTLRLSVLLEGYEQVRPFDRAELRLIEPLRTLRLIHYSAWLASRWQDPTFPIHFPYFGTPDYWREQVILLQEQIEQMQAPVLVV